MWKKFLILFIGFMGIFSIVYANDVMMNAASSAYNAGGAVNGRVNLAPNGISGSHIGMKKGDKVLMGTENPLDHLPMSWMLLKYETYTDYGCTTRTPCVGKPEMSAWLTGSTRIIYTGQTGFTKASFVMTGFGNPKEKGAYFNQSDFIDIIDQLDTAVKANPADGRLVTYRCLVGDHEYGSYTFGGHMGYYAEMSLFKPSTDTRLTDLLLDSVFLPSRMNSTDGTYGPLVKDKAFSHDYFQNMQFHVDGTVNEYTAYGTKKDGSGTTTPYQLLNGYDHNLRPFVFLDLSKVVFAVSRGSASTIAKVKEPNLQAGYTSIYDATLGDQEMKLRYLDQSLTSTLHDIKSKAGSSISAITTEEHVYLQVNANQSASANGVNTISVLVFDENDHFVYYQPLEPVKSSGLYEFDTTGIPVGKYRIAVVNEVYNEATTSPADSSALSEVLPLEIRSPLSKINVQPKTGLEYRKNVKVNDSVADITNTGGISPITYSVISDSSASSHALDYQNFKIGVDGSGNPAVLVNNPDGLEAGTYYFKVHGVDAHGNPIGGIDSNTVTVTVSRTDPDLKFTTTTPLDKIMNAPAFSEAFTHKNDEPTDADFALSYSSSLPNVATVDAPAGANDTDVLITPGNTAGTTTIKVELAETKNYKAASATLTVNVHPKIALTFTPEKSSFAVSDVAVKGTKIGTVTLTGNSPDYEYTMAVHPENSDLSKDNSLFRIATNAQTTSTSMDVLTDNSNIPQGEYYMTIKATDRFGQTAYAAGIITVSGSVQTGFDFYDYQHASNKLTNGTLTVYYGENNAKLIAKGGQSTGGITYGVADVTSVLDIDPATGAITVHDIGKVKVNATKAADGAYQAITISMYVDVKPCEQEIAFDQPATTTISYQTEHGNTFTERASGTIKGGMPDAGKTGIGPISYTLGGADQGIASIADDGTITIASGQNITSNKTFTVTAKLNDPAHPSYNSKYGSASITKTVNVYPPGIISWKAKKPYVQAGLNNGTEKVGELTMSGGSGNVSYASSASGDPENLDKAFFQINPLSGEVQLTKAITASDLSSKAYNATEQAYELHAMFEVNDGGFVTTEKLTIYIAGAERTGLDFKNRDGTTKEIIEYYGAGRSFTLSLNQTLTNTTYRDSLKHPASTNAVTIHPDGTVDILHENEDRDLVYAEAVVPAFNGYEETIVEAGIRIKRSLQELVFDQPGITTIYYDPANGNSFHEGVTGSIKTGMPEGGNPGVGPYTFLLQGSDAGIAGIDTSGTITLAPSQNITASKTFTVTAKLNDPATALYDSNYGSASVIKTIKVYPPGSVAWNQLVFPQADQNSGTEKIGELTMSGGSGQVSYAISASGDPDNIDQAYFHVDPISGDLYLKNRISVAEIAAKAYNETEQAYEMQVMIDVKDGTSITTEHLTIYIVGAPRANLEFKNKDVVSREITETYEANKSFRLSLNQNIPNTAYRISSNAAHPSPADVITVNADGTAQIMNANEVIVDGSSKAPVYVEAVIPAQDGYEQTTVEAAVRIKRAVQNLAFPQDPINTSADIQSLNITMLGHKDSNSLVYNTSDSKVKIVADPSDGDSMIIKPNGVVKNGITITAIAQGDRNYKDHMKTATLNIAKAETNQFTAIFPNMTYGDSGPFKVIISPAGSGSETYAYTVKDTSILEVDTDGTIVVHHAGTTIVEVTQTSAAGTIGPYAFSVTVDPKPITVTIDDQAKYTGMSMPAFTAQIASGDLVNGDHIPQPAFHCVDDTGMDIDDHSGPGLYPISGTYPTGVITDYDITVMDGELTVKQDQASTHWYELNDSEGNKTSNTTWHKGYVDVVLKAANASAGTYDQISGTAAFANSDPTRFRVDQDGETTQDIYFRIDPNGGDPNRGAMTEPIQETIRIDNTPPVIKSITGNNKNTSKLRMALNSITFGKYFKPGMVVTIEAEDVVPSAGVSVSGIQKISYEIVKLDETGTPTGNPNKMEQNDTSVEVSLKDAGAYEVCANATDLAGNESVKKCERISIRKWGESSDDQELPDINIDLDHDGTPDINITRPGELRPYLNIDIDGDGIADINIAKQGEKVVPGKTEPYLNIMDPRVKWNPTKEIDYDHDGEPDFRTDASLSAILFLDSNDDHIPDLNIDLNGDYIADLNIDVNGDRKTAQTNIDSDGDQIADINIDLDGDGTPDSMIATNYTWNATLKVKNQEGDILYATTPDIEIDTIDSITDGGVIVKPDGEGSGFLPNYALKVTDITKDTSDRKKQELIEISGNVNGEVVKIYDIKMVVDHEPMQPDGTVTVHIPYDATMKNVKLLLKAKDGSWNVTSYEIVGKYMIFQTAYIGEIALIQEQETAQEPTAPDGNEPNPDDQKSPSSQAPTTDVQGSYTGNSTQGIGGAYTGDHTQLWLYLGGLSVSLLILGMLKKRKKPHRS